MAAASIQRIDMGGVDTAVTKQVGKAQQVFLHGVEHPGEQMAQGMGKHLFRIHTGRFAQTLHGSPYGKPVQRLAL